MNYRMVCNVLGKVLLAEALLLLLPLASALSYGESPLPLIFTILPLVAVGGGLNLVKIRKTDLFAREGFVIVGLSWILMSAFGALPFVFSGDIPHYVDAFFETVSGFTTTGASILTDIEGMSRGCMFWRLFTHWIGGMGVLVFIAAILPVSGDHYMHIMRAEVPGPEVSKLVPRARKTARILYLIYLGMTLIETGLLVCGGMSFYDALLHAFSTAGTGGFSTHSESIAYYDSVAIEMAVTFCILVAGVSFALYYRVYVRGWRALTENTEFKAYIVIFFAGTAMLWLNLWWDGIYGVWESLRYAAFQTAAISTTGFASADFDRWPTFAKCLLLFLMMVGGCAGSTAAGLKVTRAVLLLRMTAAHIWQRLHPHMVISVRMNGDVVPPGVLLRVGLFFFIYLFFIVSASALIMLDGVPMFDAIGMSVSAVSTVGPAFGSVGPTETYAPFSPFVKMVLCCITLLGRLEFFTLLVMLRLDFWQEHKGW